MSPRARRAGVDRGGDEAARRPGADDVYRRARVSDKELVDLNYQVISINAFNRLAVPFRAVRGNYRPGMFDKPGAFDAPAGRP